MDFKTPQKTNPQHFINKAEKEQILSSHDTIKIDDKHRGTHIKPYLPVAICDNLIYQNVYLQTCIETLAEDMVLNDINITPVNKADEVKAEIIKDFWLLNQDELVKTVTDYISYGFGGAEITFTNGGEPQALFEIQADTLYIKKETYNDTVTGESRNLYYAVQQVNGSDYVKMRLLQNLDEYPEKDSNLKICLWIGGGRKSNYFNYPLWISAFNHVSASVSLDMLDADKLANGNLISGILTVIRPPMSLDDENVEDTLESKMEAKGSGVFTLELNTLNPDIPLTVDYIQISESNYQYLSELADKSDSKILSVLKIPKARLLIDDTTESMNSNKTNTLYKIYSGELENRQRPLERLMKIFNQLFYEFTGKVNIITPVFVDDKEIETQINLNLFNNGLITLGQAIRKVEDLFPEYKEYLEKEIDYNNPLYDERYYNGKPLGFSEDLNNPVTELGDMIDYAKVNGILQQQSEDR